jgi:hypothetical protein
MTSKMGMSSTKGLVLLFLVIGRHDAVAVAVDLLNVVDGVVFSFQGQGGGVQILRRIGTKYQK